MSSNRAMARAVLAGTAVALAAAWPAHAAVPVSYSCKASAVTAQVAGGSVLDPIAAGDAASPCRPAVTGLPNVAEALSLDDVVKARTAYAATSPGGSRPLASRPLARAGVEGLDVALGGQVLSVGAARSSITAQCSAGRARFTPASEVASITLGGRALVLDGVLQPITDGLDQALGALVQVRLDEVVDLPGGGKAVRAAHVTLVRGSTPLADVVVAESRLEAGGAVCDPAAPGNAGDAGDAGGGPGGAGAGGGESGGGPKSLGQVCPPGSVFDPVRTLCVIPAPGSRTAANPAGDLSGVDAVVVGRPYQGPQGGTVVSLAAARQKYASPCLKGPGPRYVVVGSRRGDRITGTNRRDRILGRGGRDRIDAGRNRDCVDGGTSRDVMTGGQEDDRVYGGRGNDVVNGDSGDDRLSGGEGNDSFNAGYGADRVYGGRGRDAINVATAGRRAKVWAGKGYDIVRCNPEERRAIRGAERIHEVIRVKG